MKMLNKINKKIINKLIYLISSRSQLKILTSLGLSDKLSRDILKKLRIFQNYREYRYRLKLARNILKNNKTQFTIKEDFGFCSFDFKSFPKSLELMKSSNQIIRNHQKEEKKINQFYSGGKKFFKDLLTPEDLLSNPIFIEFATDVNLISSITKYLGIFPVLGNIRIIETIENDTCISSQLFHLDPEDYKQVKIFINLTDVALENGPLTVLNAKKTKKVKGKILNPYGRVSDKNLFKLTNKGDYFQSIGPKGSAFAVDTCSCFHMGSRTRKNNRIVLLISYLSFPCIVEPGRTSNLDFTALGLGSFLKNEEYAKMLFRSLRPNYLT